MCENHDITNSHAAKFDVINDGELIEKQVVIRQVPYKF